MVMHERIPYANWINSQLSVARFYGGITFNGVSYEIEKDTNDLVAVASIKKNIREAKAKRKEEKRIQAERAKQEQINSDLW